MQPFITLNRERILYMTQNTLKKAAAAVAVVAALWLGARFLLPAAMPFLLGALVALAAEPLTAFFGRRAKLSRGLSTALGVSITLLLLLLGVSVLGALVVRELGTLAGILPDLESTALQGMHTLEDRLLSIAQRTPESVRPLVTRSVQGFFSDGTAVMDRVSTVLLGLASGIVTRIPDSAIGFGTWIIAGFMISARLPDIRRKLGEMMPPAWHERWVPVLKRLKKSVFGWLFAQARLVGVTGLVLSAGFLLLRIPYALLWAALIALVDALPVLGSGTVLVPWSIICFLQGEHVRGIGLLGIYAAAALLRSVLEPKLVGKQLGLDPLITLAAMYAGYRFWGIGGMLLSPLLAVTAAQLLTTGKGDQ
jgi:sporulation integral membrane protein YtvI